MSTESIIGLPLDAKRSEVEQVGEVLISDCKRAGKNIVPFEQKTISRHITHKRI